MKILVEMGDTEYRLSGGGEEGATVPYGFPAALMVGNDVFYACVVDPDAQTAEAYRVDSVSPVDDVELEEVTFGDDEDDDNDGLEPGGPDGDPDEDQDDQDDDDDEDEGEIVDVTGGPVEETE